MKKVIALALVLSSVVASNAFGGIFGFGNCGGCRPRCSTTEVCTEPRPNCYKMVRKECPARKVCETTCHWVCPPDTIREDNAECGE